MYKVALRFPSCPKTDVFFPSVFSVSPGSLSLHGDCGVLVFPGSVLSIGVPLLLGEMSFLPKALGTKKAKICRGRSLRITVILKSAHTVEFTSSGRGGSIVLEQRAQSLDRAGFGVWYPTLHLGTQVFPHLPTAEPNQRTHREHGSVPKPGIPTARYGASVWSTTKNGMLLMASTAWEWLVGVRMA